MAGKQIAGDGLPPSLAGMSKNQLYEIMSQMKTLIEQSQQHAQEILIQNPALKRALFSGTNNARNDAISTNSTNHPTHTTPQLTGISSWKSTV